MGWAPASLPALRPEPSAPKPRLDTRTGAPAPPGQRRLPSACRLPRRTAPWRAGRRERQARPDPLCYRAPVNVGRPLRNRAELARFSDGAEYRLRAALENRIAEREQARKFTLPGICSIDDAVVDFLVDRKCGALRKRGRWYPNWRERLQCPACRLNNRQRAIAAPLLGFMQQREGGSAYLMEQVTPSYQVIRGRLTRARCTGSEFVGAQYRSGEVIRGIRHEDATRLSFGDGTQDAILSNDVFEHVPEPEAAFREAARVLKEDGVMFFSVPFFADRDENRSRAALVNGTVRHLLPAEYHGNPIARKGSLVFTEFGWELLEQVRQAGFADAYAVPFWDLAYGHLGVNNTYFVATKSSSAPAR